MLFSHTPLSLSLIYIYMLKINFDFMLNCDLFNDKQIPVICQKLKQRKNKLQNVIFI